jgi:hypothetical protein
MEKALIPATIKLPQLPPELRNRYEQLLSGTKSFAKATPDGVEIGGVVHPSITGRVVSWRLYWYRWGEGLAKLEFDLENTSESDVASMGLKKGVSFSFEAKGFSEPIAFDCPVSTFISFSNYGSSLVSRGLTLECVITRIATAVKTFKLGSAPVLTFELVGPATEANVVDAQFTQHQTPQTKAQPATNQIPSAWQ